MKKNLSKQSPGYKNNSAWGRFTKIFDWPFIAFIGETFSIPNICLRIFYRNFLLFLPLLVVVRQPADCWRREEGGVLVSLGPAFVSVKLLEISPLHHLGQLARPDSNLHIAKDPQLQDYFDPETNCRDLIYLQHFISLHLHGAWEPWSQCGPVDCIGGVQKESERLTRMRLIVSCSWDAAEFYLAAAGWTGGEQTDRSWSLGNRSGQRERTVEGGHSHQQHLHLLNSLEVGRQGLLSIIYERSPYTTYHTPTQCLELCLTSICFS